MMRVLVLALSLALIVWRSGCMTLDDGALVNRCGLWQWWSGRAMRITADVRFDEPRHYWPVTNGSWSTLHAMPINTPLPEVTLHDAPSVNANVTNSNSNAGACLQVVNGNLVDAGPCSTTITSGTSTTWATTSLSNTLAIQSVSTSIPVGTTTNALQMDSTGNLKLAADACYDLPANTGSYNKIGVLSLSMQNDSNTEKHVCISGAQ